MASVEERLEEEQVDDVQTTGLDEVVEILVPYLDEPKEVQSFKELLQKLGISNISQMDQFLLQTDVASFINVISFRQMKKDREQKLKEKKDNNPAAKQGHGAAYIFNLSDCIKCKSLKEKLAKDEELLLKVERTKIIHGVADNYRDYNTVIAEHQVNRIAYSIVKDHPTSFGCLMFDDAEYEDAAGELCKSILSHIRYCQAEERARKRKTLGDLGNDGNKKRSKSDNFTKAQNFGLQPERDLPRDYPPGENALTQETKRSALETMFSQGQRDMEVVMKNMQELYVSIRIDVNKKLRMEPLLKRWPFIGMYPVLETHFEYLMNSSVSDLFQQFQLRYDSLEKFFEARAHELSKAKESSKGIAGKLKDEIKMFRNLGDNTTNVHRSIFMLRCAMFSMKMQLDELFVHFTDVTSFDEVQASDKFSKDGRPLVAVLGSNPYAQETRAFVVVENRCISDVAVPVLKGVIMTYMSYFVFKIPYSKKAAPILYFLQSKVFKIKGEGSKTRREKLPNGSYTSNPSKKPQVYLKFWQLYKEYCLTWNVPALNSK